MITIMITDDNNIENNDNDNANNSNSDSNSNNNNANANTNNDNDNDKWIINSVYSSFSTGILRIHIVPSLQMAW